MGQLLRPAARLTPGSFFYSWAGLLRPYAGNALPIWGRLLFTVEMTWNEMRRRGRARGATL